MELAKSDIVLSLSGRDKGKYFFVVETAGDYALIADGKRRKLERPKRKKQKHLQRSTALNDTTEAPRKCLQMKMFG